MNKYAEHSKQGQARHALYGRIHNPSAKSCVRKRIYDTPEDAQKFLEDNLYPGNHYRCPHCYRWHITTKGGVQWFITGNNREQKRKRTNYPKLVSLEGTAPTSPAQSAAGPAGTSVRDSALPAPRNTTEPSTALACTILRKKKPQTGARSWLSPRKAATAKNGGEWLLQERRSRFRRRSNGGKPYHTKLFALDKALWNRENNGRPFNKH